MECNKDEALRAKEIAEKRFLCNDLRGAKKFALKSVELYPLEEVQKMMATFDVYLNAESKVNGETDWYRVLGVSPQADDDSVRQHFRQMALSLHPDKNKSVGAEGAFQHISEAWNVLSDKGKRAAYDQRRKARSYNAPSSTEPSSSNPGTNGFYNFSKSNPKASKGKTSHTSYNASQKSKSNTFWTVCHRCKMQYEYLRVYLNHNLLCPNCHEAFLAIEVPAPRKSSTRCSFDFYQHPDDRSGRRGASASGRYSNGVADSSSPYANWAFSGRSDAVHAASVVQRTYEKVRREREEAQAASRRDERRRYAKRMSSNAPANAAKRRKGMEEAPASSLHGNGNSYQLGGRGNVPSFYTSENKYVGSVRVNDGASWSCDPKGASCFDIHSMLKNKARNEISKKFQELNSISEIKPASHEETCPVKKVEPLGGKEAMDQKHSVDSSQGGNKMCKSNSLCCSLFDKNISEILKPFDLVVVEPDVNDFDKDRTESAISQNQVWAVYAGEDGMPRRYVFIHNVISLKPFQVNLSWLNPRRNGGLNPLKWGASGFSKTCGDFQVGRHRMIYTFLDSYSHRVKFSRVSDEIIRIYPMREDIWALYRNWSPCWNELTAYEVIDEYDLVEVLEDYSDDYGVTVIPLIKVARFKTIFHRHLDMEQIWRIPKEEFDRFSHFIPSRLLKGQEVPHPLLGCVELDPAATPTKFLRVIQDIDEVELMDDERASTTDSASHVKMVNNQIIEIQEEDVKMAE